MKTEDHKISLRANPQHLQKINGIHFTLREIDVISFLMSGRSGKKIAFCLTISPKTVENHIRNIMAKIECNSKESIINFCETAGADRLLKSHYENLLNDALFNQSIQQIAKICRNKSLFCTLIYFKKRQLQDPFIIQLESHLKLVGIRMSLQVQEACFMEQTPQTGSIIYIQPKHYARKETNTVFSQPNLKALFLIPEGEENIYESQEWFCLTYSDRINTKQYYELFFKLMEYILPFHEWKQFIPQFKGNSEGGQIHFISHSPLPHVNGKKFSTNTKNEIQSLRFLKNKIFLFLTLTTLFVICLYVFLYRVTVSEDQHNLIRTDLILPAESVLLDRHKFIDLIDHSFHNGTQDTIKVLAIIGAGGAGKTTLAHHYARQENAQIIWEIDAETQESLKASFEKLADHLTHSEEDKKILREIQHIKQAQEKEDKILSFIQEHLRLFPNWLLIYDNVEQFLDIQKHFPQDAKLWGSGRIILTTQNANIQNNNLVSNVIHIGELSPNQKFDLFTRIMSQGDPKLLTSPSTSEIIEFLKNIPPFPLDVSVAAYYLKSTNISYAQYIEKIENHIKEINNLHENILKETGKYTKTRYAIITHSLEHLIKADKDFSDLLLFISLLDSQKIPKELLDCFKSSNIVDNFIYHLKKHSLLTTQSSGSSEPIYSIHRSTQTISLTYLLELLNLNERSPLLQRIVYALDDYTDRSIEQEDFPIMQIIARHLEKILRHNLLTDLSRGILESKLGNIYYFIDTAKAKKLIDNSFIILKTKNLDNLSSEDAFRLARSLLSIGAVYTELKLDREAKESFGKALDLYNKKCSKNTALLSLTLSHLGNLQNRLGNYEKARDCLEKSVRLHKQHRWDDRRLARTLAYLGVTYRGLGLYQEAINTLKESLGPIHIW